MTQLLYYDDTYTAEFSACIVERLIVGNQPAVILDRTYFYPIGGGQPSDRGTIGGTEVVDVFSREDDHAVLHLLADEIHNDEVQCVVDWDRRFDHMQHHTGQHILTEAFIQVADANTVGFHLGVESVTIDLDVPYVSPKTLADIEDLANQVVYENRPVTAHLMDPEDVADVRIRKMPDYFATGKLRIVEIENLGVTACGGTHVARTGEVGMIKVIKLEKRGEETRVDFRCGMRALRDYRGKNDMVNRLAAEFTVGQWEIDQAIERLKADLKASRQGIKAAQTKLLEYEAQELLQAAIEHSGMRIVSVAFDNRAIDEVRALTSCLIETPGTIALLGTSGDKAQVIVARSDDLPHDMTTVLKYALRILGSGRGGGRSDFAQGGGVSASVEMIQTALNEAQSSIIAIR